MSELFPVDARTEPPPLRLVESPVPMNSLEIGWLMAAAIWDRSAGGDRTARSIYRKLKAAAIANGVEWYYGDPFPIDGKEPGT